MYIAIQNGSSEMVELLAKDADIKSFSTKILEKVIFFMKF